MKSCEWGSHLLWRLEFRLAYSYIRPSSLPCSSPLRASSESLFSRIQFATDLQVIQNRAFIPNEFASG